MLSKQVNALNWVDEKTKKDLDSNAQVNDTLSPPKNIGRPEPYRKIIASELTMEVPSEECAAAKQAAAKPGQGW